VESLDNNEMFMALHRDYFHCEVEKNRINLRNAICEQVAPLLQSVVWKFSSHGEFNFDMFQEVTIRVLTVIIPGWKPTRHSTDGYYRKSFQRACLNYLRSQKRREEMESLIDPTMEGLWNFAGKSTEELTYNDTFKFVDEMVQTIYEECLSELEHNRLEERMLFFLADLKGRYACGRPQLREILDHAKVTFRESYERHVRDYDQPLDNESLWGRLCTYLDAETANKLIKIFGGCVIKIPDWKGGDK